MEKKKKERKPVAQRQNVVSDIRLERPDLKPEGPEMIDEGRVTKKKGQTKQSPPVLQEFVPLGTAPKKTRPYKRAEVACRWAGAVMKLTN